MSITERREVADSLVNDYAISIVRASLASSVSRTALYRRPSYVSDDADVKAQLNDLMERWPRWGFWKCFHWLRGQGQKWNHKKFGVFIAA